MGQCDAPDVGRSGQVHHVFVRAVAPGLLRAVLLGRVLGVVDHEVGIGHEPGVPSIALVQDGLDAVGIGPRPPQLLGERLVVHQVHDRHAVGLDPVAQRYRRMIEKLRGDSNPADLVDALGKVVVADGRRQLVQLDRKIRELHLSASTSCSEPRLPVGP
jgi:hypothetical protein